MDKQLRYMKMQSHIAACEALNGEPELLIVRRSDDNHVKGLFPIMGPQWSRELVEEYRQLLDEQEANLKLLNRW